MGYNDNLFPDVPRLIASLNIEVDGDPDDPFAVAHQIALFAVGKSSRYPVGGDYAQGLKEVLARDGFSRKQIEEGLTQEIADAFEHFEGRDVLTPRQTRAVAVRLQNALKRSKR